MTLSCSTKFTKFDSAGDIKIDGSQLVWNENSLRMSAEILQIHQHHALLFVVCRNCKIYVFSLPEMNVVGINTTLTGTATAALAQNGKLLVASTTGIYCTSLDDLMFENRVDLENVEVVCMALLGDKIIYASSIGETFLSGRLLYVFYKRPRTILASSDDDSIVKIEFADGSCVAYDVKNDTIAAC